MNLPLRLRSPLILFTVLALLLGCQTAPVTGRQQLLLVPEDQMQAMGVQAYREMLAKSPVTRDPKLVEPVREVGRRIAAVADRPDYEWEFAVIEEPKTVNAWVLPGGKAAVYTGLLNLGVTEDELAAVVAHEVGHAIAQHGRERLSQQLGVNLGLDILGASGGLSSGQLEVVNLALGLGVGLPFSRLQESEADLIGLNLMARAGYDPRAALSLWQKMEEAAGGENAVPELLSTHPSTATRMENIRDYIPKVMPLYEQARGSR